MGKKLIICQTEFNNTPCLATAIFDDEVNRIIDLQISRKDNESILGNIYVGKVQKIATHLNAAFIDIRPNFSCYYPFAKNKTAHITSTPKRDELKAGDELLVQVSTEALREKIPTVSSLLNITGQYAALTTGKSGVRVSAKLDIEQRARLKELLLPYSAEDVGIVVRTNAAHATNEDVISDVKELFARWDKIRQLGESRKCYSLIEKAVPDYVQTLRGIKNDDLIQIITDDEEVYKHLQDYEVRFYDDRMLSLANLYSIESTLAGALQEKVWLKSGGFLIIQQTVAFVAIDVNSGKFQSKKDAALTYQRINEEAAVEIAIQLRLRNLSGIILIDFINMDLESYQEKLLENLRKYLHKDNVKAVVVDITPLHIVEVTRKKSKKSLAEQIAEI